MSEVCEDCQAISCECDYDGFDLVTNPDAGLNYWWHRWQELKKRLDRFKDVENLRRKRKGLQTISEPEELIEELLKGRE